jgi:hypothetical protein
MALSLACSMFTDISERNERKTPKRPSKSSLPCFSKHRAPCWRHLNRPAALRTAELCPSSWRNRLAVFRKPTWRLAEELARRAATVVENARLYAESKKGDEALGRPNEELQRANEDLNQFAIPHRTICRSRCEWLLFSANYSPANTARSLMPKARNMSGSHYRARGVEMLLKDLLAFGGFPVC